MKIKLLTISKGLNDISLGSIGLEWIKKIEFEGNDREFTFYFQKYSSWNGGTDRRYRYKSKNGQKIPTSPFQLCRDGMSHLRLESSCDGILTFYEGSFWSETSEAEKAKIKFDDKCKEKHYGKFFDFSTNPIKYEYDKLKKYKPYSKDEILVFLNNSHGKKQITNVEKIISIPRLAEILVDIEIDSFEDTSVNVGLIDFDFNHKSMHEVFFTFDIKKGKHIYPLILPIGSICYHNVGLEFEDLSKIDNLTFNYIVLEKKYRDLLVRKNSIMNNHGVRLLIRDGMIGRCPLNYFSDI